MECRVSQAPSIESHQSKVHESDIPRDQDDSRNHASFETCRSFTLDSFVFTSQFRLKSLTVMFSSQFWISGLERSWFRMLVEAKKKSKDRRNLLFTFFFIAMKKKTMLGYETRLWKCKFAYLNQEDFFVHLTKRRIKKLLLRIFITYTILFNFKNTKIM